MPSDGIDVPLRAGALALPVCVLAGTALGSTAAPAREEASIVHDGDRLAVDPAADRTIRVATGFDAGTEPSIRVQSAGDTQPAFVRTDTATVGADGNASAAFDFSDQPPGNEFEVTVVRGEATVASLDGRVAGATATATPTPTSTGDSPRAFGHGLGAVGVAVGVGLARTRR